MIITFVHTKPDNQKRDRKNEHFVVNIVEQIGFFNEIKKKDQNKKI